MFNGGGNDVAFEASLAQECVPCTELVGGADIASKVLVGRGILCEEKRFCGEPPIVSTNRDALFDSNELEGRDRALIAQQQPSRTRKVIHRHQKCADTERRKSNRTVREIGNVILSARKRAAIVQRSVEFIKLTKSFQRE